MKSKSKKQKGPKLPTRTSDATTQQQQQPPEAVRPTLTRSGTAPPAQSTARSRNSPYQHKPIGNAILREQEQEFLRRVTASTKARSNTLSRSLHSRLVKERELAAMGDHVSKMLDAKLSQQQQQQQQ